MGVKTTILRVQGGMKEHRRISQSDLDGGKDSGTEPNRTPIGLIGGGAELGRVFKHLPA